MQKSPKGDSTPTKSEEILKMSPVPLTDDEETDDGDTESNCSSLSKVSAAAVPKKVFTISERWDLIIQLETNELLIDYHVCRAVLALASPVFSRMVDVKSPFRSTFKQRRPDGSEKWYLGLYEDDPNALLVFLQIIHLKTEMIPTREITFSQLLAVTKLVDKYDCVKIIDPWKDRWIGNLYKQALTTGFESWLYICVVLGKSANFKMLTRHLITEFRANNHDGPEDDKKTQERNETPVSVLEIPEKLFADIWQKRTDALTKIHCIVRRLLTQLETGNMPPCPEACTAAAYGRFIISSKSNSIWSYIKNEKVDFKTTEKLRLSVNGFKVIISNMLEEIQNLLAKVKHVRICESSCKIAAIRNGIELVYDAIEGLDHKDYSRYKAHEPAVWEQV